MTEQTSFSGQGRDAFGQVGGVNCPQGDSMKAPPKTLAMALSVLGLLGTSDVVAADLKQHLIAAIDAPDGRSDGELSGRMAEFFKGQTRSSAPVRVQVRTLRKFAERPVALA
jgi:hypothetical protein